MGCDKGLGLGFCCRGAEVSSKNPNPVTACIQLTPLRKANGDNDNII